MTPARISARFLVTPCTVPRPIGWISTLSRDGKSNLAPFSQWQNITYDPPIVMFSADQHVDGRKKDTVINAQETGYFVWNMATYDLRQAINKSAQPVPRGVDEFELAGVTKIECIEAPGPRVAESPCHFECRYLKTVHFPGTTKVSNADVVFGEVVRIHIKEEFVLPSGTVPYCTQVNTVDTNLLITYPSGAKTAVNFSRQYPHTTFSHDESWLEHNVPRWQ
jgi:flavin reductase (DIM6/NTAB) family NADH-FMN oxidoreductase RutF